MHVLVNNLTFMAVNIGDYTFDYINNANNVGYELYHKDGTFIESGFLPKGVTRRLYLLNGAQGEFVGYADVYPHGFTLKDRLQKEIIEVINNAI